MTIVEIVEKEKKPKMGFSTEFINKKIVSNKNFFSDDYFMVVNRD